MPAGSDLENMQASPESSQDGRGSVESDPRQIMKALKRTIGPDLEKLAKKLVKNPELTAELEEFTRTEMQDGELRVASITTTVIDRIMRECEKPNASTKMKNLGTFAIKFMDFVGGHSQEIAELLSDPGIVDDPFSALMGPALAMLLGRIAELRTASSPDMAAERLRQIAAMIDRSEHPSRMLVAAELRCLMDDLQESA